MEIDQASIIIYLKDTFATFDIHWIGLFHILYSSDHKIIPGNILGILIGACDMTLELRHLACVSLFIDCAGIEFIDMDWPKAFAAYVRAKLSLMQACMEYLTRRECSIGFLLVFPCEHSHIILLSDFRYKKTPRLTDLGATLVKST
jgi:hypothetical protein